MFHKQTVQQVIAAGRKLRELRSSADASMIVEVLEELADYVVDERVLDQTKIGFKVVALRTHGDGQVAQRAQALVAIWRRDLERRSKAAIFFMERTKLPLEEAKKLEEGLFNAACPLGFLEGEGCRSYNRHFIRLATHLRSRGPGTLIERLKLGEVAIEDVAWVADEELLSIGQADAEFLL